jgi:hypothetical protein
MIVNMENNPSHKEVADWIKKNDIKILNVAGPRESFMPGVVYKQKKNF